MSALPLLEPAQGLDDEEELLALLAPGSQVADSVDDPEHPGSSSLASGSWFSLLLGFLEKNELMPFCQSGVGLGQTGLPPAYLPADHA